MFRNYWLDKRQVFARGLAVVCLTFTISMLTLPLDVSGKMTPKNFGTGIVNVSARTVEFDAALAANGGYAWDTNSKDEDVSKLIDGDGSTYFDVNVDNPALNADLFPRGFQKIAFGSRVLISRVEIEQRGSYAQATMIRIMTDDGTVSSFNLTKDLVDRWGSKSISKLPLNKETSSISIYIDDVNKQNYGPYWTRVSAFTEDRSALKPTAVDKVSSTDAIIDFSKDDGVLSRGFGVTELQASVERPFGWEENAWETWKSLKPGFQRVTLGDEWPHNYGTDLEYIAKLDQGIGNSQTTMPLVPGVQLEKDDVIKIGSEHIMISGVGDNTLDLTRGVDETVVSSHSKGASVYKFSGVGHVGRATQLLPEFKRTRYKDAVLENISADQSPGTITVNKDMFATGDVIQIDQEVMKVVSVTENGITAKRGFDGTEISEHWVGSDIYKLIDYKPVYDSLPDNPNEAANYDWHYWDQVFDKIVNDANATPWIIAAAPSYMYNSRGYISKITGNNLQDASKNWWLKDNGDGRQFKGGKVYIISGKAEGKSFVVANHTKDTLCLQDGVDLNALGVASGDAYKVVPAVDISENLQAPSRERWQDYLDYWYQISNHLVNRYPNSRFYLEFWNEPELFGHWTDQTYIELFSKFSATIRTGNPGHQGGFPADRVKVGAGSSASGFRNGFDYVGTNYRFFEQLIGKAPYIDFVSHHDYGVKQRVDKRAASWETSFLKRMALSCGKNIEVIDSENNVIDSDQSEGISHSSAAEIPYWGSEFINYFYGDQGASGRHSGAIMFMLCWLDDHGYGLFSKGKALSEYWAFKLFADNTSSDGSKDSFAKVLKPGDAFGWVQTMAINQPNGRKKVFIVNKKDTPISLNLKLLGIDGCTDFKISRINGSGDHRTVSDGYQQIDNGGIMQEQLVLSSLKAITLEPNSFNVVSFSSPGN